MPGPDNLVLLFYDGYERQAEEAPVKRLKAEAKRFARMAWRTLRRKQVWTGRFMTYRTLRLALETAGYTVKVNDFAAARRYPDHPIAACGYVTVIDKVKDLPNPRLLGPGLYDSPLQNPTLMQDPLNRLYIQRCDWEMQIFKPFYGDAIRMWYRGYDLALFEDVRGAAKTNDVLIYDKIYHDREAHYARTIAPFIEMLKAQGLSYEIVEYGKYHHHDYVDALRRSRVMAFFAHSEVMGNAQLEASAMNVPVYAWDEGVWLDPKAKKLSDKPVPASSVTHFDDRCGVRFTMATMKERWPAFWAARETFEPRAYVAEELPLKGSADLYMRHYREAGGLAPARQAG